MRVRAQYSWRRLIQCITIPRPLSMGGFEELCSLRCCLVGFFLELKRFMESIVVLP